MKQRFHSMSLQMLYISLVPKYTKYISRNVSKSTFFFTYILVPVFRFVYRGCMWRSFTVTSLSDNLHSMFYQHIRSHHTRDLPHILSVSCLHERPGLDGPGQYLLKLVSSVPVLTEAVDGLPSGLCRRRSCLGNSSMLHKRASQKSLCEIFFPPHEGRRM